ncbi:MoaD/ThiS family protein [Pseudonocardia eucalypti]|uniref:MoaD/ThiS family protein n=1 Tax=Pseudonocardia eucalypti TaxID=648755 RepID=A0ABP9PLF5_9PSEU|nr:molybdopterin converting factor small subunit [Pseudonocardia eucalypti]
MITVRYFAGARAAAGLESEPVAIPEGATVDDVLALIGARHGAALQRVLTASSLLLDEVAVRSRTHPIPPNSTLDILPPFAGG